MKKLLLLLTLGFAVQAQARIDFTSVLNGEWTQAAIAGVGWGVSFVPWSLGKVLSSNPVQYGALGAIGLVGGCWALIQAGKGAAKLSIEASKLLKKVGKKLDDLMKDDSSSQD